MNSDNDVEKLLRQEHIRPEDLLTDGPNNQNQHIETEDTTVANTKGESRKASQPANAVRVRRQLRIETHTDIHDLFMPLIVLGYALIAFCQAVVAVAIVML
ncbi:unnamed protein product [Caenorhabditis sp. 36 PRJEB53466]|nr:unnamed protein product [Caenorhabditis sp. 36 PRJEB53466]